MTEMTRRDVLTTATAGGAALALGERITLPSTPKTSTDDGSRLFSIAVAQLNVNFHPEPATRIATNLASFSGLAGAIKALKKPDMIVGPEVAFQGPDTFGLRQVAQPIPGPISNSLSALAKSLGVWLIPGTIIERGSDGKVYNALPVFNPNGDLVAKYRKLYPAVPVETSDPGDQFVVFDIPGKGRFGVMICYDSMQPEIARTLAWMGADVIIKPAFQDDSEGGERCRLPVGQVMAMQQQLFVVDCNAAAPLANGMSGIIDPEGRILESLGRDESFTCAVIDLAMTQRVRDRGSFAGGFTFLKDWARQNHTPFPPYVHGPESGDVFKTLSAGYTSDLSVMQPY